MEYQLNYDRKKIIERAFKKVLMIVLSHKKKVEVINEIFIKEKLLLTNRLFY